MSKRTELDDEGNVVETIEPQFETEVKTTNIIEYLKDLTRQKKNVVGDIMADYELINKINKGIADKRNNLSDINTLFDLVFDNMTVEMLDYLKTLPSTNNFIASQFNKITEVVPIVSTKDPENACLLQIQIPLRKGVFRSNCTFVGETHQDLVDHQNDAH